MRCRASPLAISKGRAISATSNGRHASSTRPKEETCAPVDSDCDGADGDDDPDTVGAPLWFADGDGDGLGDASTSIQACERPSGYVDEAGDCDDDDADVRAERGFLEDRDGDGYVDPDRVVFACALRPGLTPSASPDCDDADPDVHPGAFEVCGDAVDQDCDALDPACDVGLASARIDGLAPSSTAFWGIRALPDLDLDGVPEVAAVEFLDDSTMVDRVIPVDAVGDLTTEEAASFTLFGPAAPSLIGLPYAADFDADGVPDIASHIDEDATVEGVRATSRILLGPLVGDRDLVDADVTVVGPPRHGGPATAVGVDDGGAWLILGWSSLVEPSGTVTFHPDPADAPVPTSWDDAESVLIGVPELPIGYLHPVDVDADGLLDLANATSFNRLGLYRAPQPPVGHTTDAPLLVSDNGVLHTVKVAFGDLDEDGHTDVVAGVHGDGDAQIHIVSHVDVAVGTFEEHATTTIVNERAQFLGQNVAVVDLNDDGWRDVVYSVDGHDDDHGEPEDAVYDVGGFGILLGPVPPGRLDHREDAWFFSGRAEGEQVGVRMTVVPDPRPDHAPTVVAANYFWGGYTGYGYLFDAAQLVP